MNPTRVAVFIDNSNVYKYLSELKKTDKKWICLYDPLKLAQKLAGDRNLVSVFFYCTPPPPQMLKTTNGKKNTQFKHNTTPRYKNYPELR